jgi:hypothetical protein
MTRPSFCLGPLHRLSPERLRHNGAQQRIVAHVHPLRQYHPLSAALAPPYLFHQFLLLNPVSPKRAIDC